MWAIRDVVMAHRVVDSTPVQTRLICPLEIGHVVNAIPQRVVQSRLQSRDVPASKCYTNTPHIVNVTINNSTSLRIIDDNAVRAMAKHRAVAYHDVAYVHC